MSRRGAAPEALLERTVRDEGQELLGWRDVPVDPEQHRASSRAPAAR